MRIVQFLFEMSAFLEFIYQIVIEGVIAQPVIFVRWLLSGRKKNYKHYWNEADIQGNAYLGLALIIIVILLFKFVF